MIYLFFLDFVVVSIKVKKLLCILFIVEPKENKKYSNFCKTYFLHPVTFSLPSGSCNSLPKRVLQSVTLSNSG